MTKILRPAPAHRLDLAQRPRRNRKAEWARRLVSEHVLTTNDLIWPLFLIEGEKKRVPVAAMPGVDRLSVDEAVREAERAAKLDIPAIAFFPYTEPHLKEEQGSKAFNESNLVCKACRAIKREFPQLGLVTDVALDPYTSHGHDGLVSDRDRRSAHDGRQGPLPRRPQDGRLTSRGSREPRVAPVRRPSPIRRPANVRCSSPPQRTGRSRATRR